MSRDQEELGIELPADSKPFPAEWIHHDEPLGRPTWIAQVVNDMLTNEEKGLLAQDVRPPRPE